MKPPNPPCKSNLSPWLGGNAKNRGINKKSDQTTFKNRGLVKINLNLTRIFEARIFAIHQNDNILYKYTQKYSEEIVVREEKAEIPKWWKQMNWVRVSCNHEKMCRIWFLHIPHTRLHTSYALLKADATPQIKDQIYKRHKSVGDKNIIWLQIFSSIKSGCFFVCFLWCEMWRILFSIQSRCVMEILRFSLWFIPFHSA